jgi:hypothetical protein
MALECPDCGAIYSKEDLFCGECGRPLSTETGSGGPSSPRAAQGPLTATRAPATRWPPREPVTRQTTDSRLRMLAGAGGAILVVLILCIVGVGVLVLSGIMEESDSNSTASIPEVVDRLLYQDDFRNPDSGWEEWDDAATSAKYVDGEYRLGVNLQDYMVWSYPAYDKDLRDFAIDVDARQVEGSLDSTFGPIVRVQTEEENYYWFQISGDGYFSVELKENGEWILLHEWEASSAINQGLDATNQLRLICYEDRFSFYVNGTHLIDVTDDALRAGSFGLAAGAYDEPPVAVDFDNLSIYELQN